MFGISNRFNCCLKCIRRIPKVYAYRSVRYLSIPLSDVGLVFSVGLIMFAPVTLSLIHRKGGEGYRNYSIYRVKITNLFFWEYYLSRLNGWNTGLIKRRTNIIAFYVVRAINFTNVRGARKKEITVFVVSTIQWSIHFSSVEYNCFVYIQFRIVWRQLHKYIGHWLFVWDEYAYLYVTHPADAFGYLFQYAFSSVVFVANRFGNKNVRFQKLITLYTYIYNIGGADA